MCQAHVSGSSPAWGSFGEASDLQTYCSSGGQWLQARDPGKPGSRQRCPQLSATALATNWPHRPAALCCRAYCYPSLSPTKDMEIVVQGRHMRDPAFQRLLHAALRTLVDELGVRWAAPPAAPLLLPHRPLCSPPRL